MAAHNPSNNQVTILAMSPQSVATASPVTVTDIDVRGFRWAMIEVALGAMDVAGGMTVQDSPTSGGTYSDITDDGVNLGVTAQTAGFTFGATEDDTIVRGQLDLQQCDDFLEFVFTAGATGTILASVTITLVSADDTDRFVRTVYDAEPLEFDIKHRLKSESY